MYKNIGATHHFQLCNKHDNRIWQSYHIITEGEVQKSSLNITADLKLWVRVCYTLSIKVHFVTDWEEIVGKKLTIWEVLCTHKDGYGTSLVYVHYMLTVNSTQKLIDWNLSTTDCFIVGYIFYFGQLYGPPWCCNRSFVVLYCLLDLKKARYNPNNFIRKVKEQLHWGRIQICLTPW